MAESTFTQTGVNELRSAIERFPAVVAARLRGVAGATAARVCARAQANLRERQKTAAHALADAIVVTEDAVNRQFVVTSRAPRGQAANVTIWNEHGTVKMTARPYMRPAADAEQARYTTDMQAAADAAAAETFSG